MFSRTYNLDPRITTILLVNFKSLVKWNFFKRTGQVKQFSPKMRELITESADLVKLWRQIITQNVLASGSTEPILQLLKEQIITQPAKIIFNAKP